MVVNTREFGQPEDRRMPTTTLEGWRRFPAFGVGLDNYQYITPEAIKGWRTERGEDFDPARYVHFPRHCQFGSGEHRRWGQQFGPQHACFVLNLQRLVSQAGQRH